ncbi:MAG: PhzF family phenazine biosynthesis protein [Candidatus Krumholzibacteria bacterium]|nr:PhzF family phenazine biosynthesis protein [Candidatus Krumholzibacteria bacterium]
MSRKLVYEHVDVFTEKPFGGNQLAVFHSPGSLNRNQMQLIAREMNFSETTFVFPSRAQGVDAKVRIFTPGEEVPFAGHPVIGTAYVIYRRTKGKKPDSIVLELGSGPVLVEVDKVTSSWIRFVMNQPLPVFGSALQNRQEAARAVGIKPFDVVGGGVVSNGLDFIIVEARDSAVVTGAALNMEEAASVCARHKVIGIYLFSRVEGKKIAVHARFFAPAVAVMEDPATGSAAGALGGYLARILKFPQKVELKIEQGTEIARKSQLIVEVGCDRGLVQSVRVCGSVVPVGEGIIRI